MVRIPLPFTDTVLLLSPRWEEVRGPLQAAVVVLLGLSPLLVFWLYRYELRLVRRSAASALLALRLILLFFLLFVVCFQPILARTRTEDLPGRVLIAVDRSASMDVADPQRPAAEKLRLARALKLAGDLCSEAQLDDWIRQWEEKKNGPDWGRTGAEERSRHDRVCERVDSLTRTQAGRRLLLPDGINLLGAVARRHRIDLVGFARESWDVPPDQAESLFRPLSVVHAPLPKSDDKGQVTNDQGQATDLRVPLARALEQTGPGEGKVLGVVVLTDGQHNWGPSPVAKAVELGDQGVPIYPVALGSRRAPPDIAVIAITAPPAVFKDADAPVEVRFKVSGMEAQEIEVELWRLKESGDKTSLDKHTIRHGGADSRYHDRFQVRMDKVGTQRLLATVHAKAKDAKETFADNNSRTVRINVADDKAHVLLVDGEARWEYHYLANALLRDRAMQLQTVVFHQPRLGRIPEEELKKIGNPALALPAEPDGLAAFDCIIVGDVSPGQLPLPERLRLEKYVADRGGTLVVLAGKRYMPLAFGSLGSSDETDPLLKLLPIQEPRAVQPTQGFPITLTTEGTLAPFLQMDAAAEESAKRWGELPPHYWGITGRAKPGAVLLASLSADAPPAGNQPSSDRERDNEYGNKHRSNAMSEVQPDLSQRDRIEVHLPDALLVDRRAGEVRCNAYRLRRARRQPR